MKLKNLTPTDLANAAYAVTPTGSIRYKATADGGYFYTKAGSPYRGMEHGYGETWEPCIHGWKALHTAIKQAQADKGEWAWAIWVNKFEIGPSDSYKLSQALATWGKHKKGIACAHAAPGGAPLAHPANAAAAAQPKPVPPVVPPPPPPPPADLPGLLDGEPILDGTEASPKYGGKRSVMVAVTSMYVLMEIRQAAAACRVPTISGDIPDHMLRTHHERVAFAVRLVNYQRTFNAAIARNFFDFNVFASMQELAHDASGHGSRYTWTGSNTATDYDPRSSLPRMAWAFRTKHGTVGHGGYGGERWARICDAGALYFTHRNQPTVFADHCVDLSHNSCLAWNKGFIFSNPASETAYTAMLDAKRAGSLLYQTALPLQISHEVYSLMQDAIRLGLMPQPTAEVSTHADPEVPFLKYGKAVLNMKTGPQFAGSKKSVLKEDHKTPLDSGPAITIPSTPKPKASDLPTLTPARA